LIRFLVFSKALQTESIALRVTVDDFLRSYILA
jgi:hypothetical protein